MSLLWTQAVRHEAMPWHHDGRSMFTHPVVHPVKKAGFASYTSDRDWEDEINEGRDDDEHEFDDDLYDHVAPEPTKEDQDHYEEHGEYPDDYRDRHDQAYEDALADRKREDIPDHDDPDLMKFVRNHGSRTDLWRKYGELKDVDLSQPVHATQSHVSQTHIDRYLHNPGDISDHAHTYGHNGQEYLGEEAPMFVTHNGAVHATEGHHRTAAALARGDKSIKGWHYDLDKDPARTKDQEEVHGDETWKDPEHWDADDHEMYSGSGW